MKKILFIVSLIFLSVLASGQGLENILVERYYISDTHDATAPGGALPAGSVTYRVYVDMATGYKLRSVFCDIDFAHDLSISTTTTFFNNTIAGETTANAIGNGDLNQNTVMVDSWISLGGASTGNIGVFKADDSNGAAYNQGAGGFLQNSDPLAGTPIRLKDGMIPGSPAAISMIGLDLSVFGNGSGSLFFAEDGSWWNTAGVTGPTPENKVLVAQLTTTGTLGFKLNFSLIKPNGLPEVYVHSNRTGEEIFCEKCTFNGVITGINDPGNHLENSLHESELKLFPNPAGNVLNIDLGDQRTTQKCDISILDILGKPVLFFEKISVTSDIINNIDISSLNTGLYVAKLKLDNGFTTVKRFIKK